MERRRHNEKNYDQKRGAILIDVLGDGKIFEPYILTAQADDDISAFFLEEIDRLGSSIRGARKRLASGRRKGRHDRISLRQRKAINESIKEKENKLNILLGREVRPVLIIRDKEDSIISWQPSFELDHKNQVWWRLVLGEVPCMLRSIQSENNMKIVKEAFDLRYKMKYGSDEQRNAANNEYFYGAFTRKIEDLSSDVVDQISPTLRGIGEKI